MYQCHRGKWTHHYCVTPLCHPQEATGRGEQRTGRTVLQSKYSCLTTPDHPLSCTTWCFPVLRIDRFDRGLRVTANHRHLHDLLTRLQGEELVITRFHTIPNQTSIISNGSFPWFCNNTNRRRNLTLHKQARAIRPNNLNILTRPSDFPHRPDGGITLNRKLVLTLDSGIRKKDREKRERIRALDFSAFTLHIKILNPHHSVSVHISTSEKP